MNRYNNGKIYKLVNDVDDEIYVGSTTGTLRAMRLDNLIPGDFITQVGVEERTGTGDYRIKLYDDVRPPFIKFMLLVLGSITTAVGFL